MSVMSGVDQRLTPDAVQSFSFRPARRGHRGCDPGAVRTFCQQVEQELARLIGERAELEEEISRLRQLVSAGSSDRRAEFAGDGAGPAGGGAGHREDATNRAGQRQGTTVQAVGILVRAEQTAGQHVAQARDYGRYLAEDARRRRSEILAGARISVESVLADAHRQASLAAEAARDQRPAADDRRIRDAETAYLRTFSEIYLAHLRACLDALRASAEEREPASPQPGPAIAPALEAPAR